MHPIRTRSKRRALWAAAGLLATSFSAHAGFVEYTFNATVSNTPVGFLGAIAVGDNVAATLKYDPATASGAQTGVSESTYTFPFPFFGGQPRPANSAYEIDVRIDGASTFEGTGYAGTIAIENDFAGTRDSFSTTIGGGGSAWFADNINFLGWGQTKITLRDLDGTTFSNTDLPPDAVATEGFDEAFIDITIGSSSQSATARAQISGIGAVETTGPVETQLTLTPADLNDGLVNVLEGIDGAGSDGAVLVDLDNLGFSAGDSFEFEAQYSRQAAGAPDPGTFNFQLPGGTFQFWDLTMDNALIPAGEMVRIILTYDDTGMSPLDESLLDLLHFDSASGDWVALGATVDTVNDTITAFTSSFSPFALGVTSATSAASVPEPTTMALLAVGIAGVGFARKAPKTR